MFKRLVRLKNVLLVISVFLIILFILSLGSAYPKNQLIYGATFSVKQARALGLDWQKVFISALDDLKIKKLRLVAYWDEVEKQDGKYEWQELDWQIKEAGSRKTDLILAVGGRLPRWPECHLPGWTNGLTKQQREEKILDYIKQTIERYKNEKQIIAWQVENEPFLSHFGDCPKLDPNFLDQEIEAVRKLDNRPIIVTDSGELSLWIPAARRADIFGTTMYRYTYSSYLKRYINYPITPAFFRAKRNLAKLFAWKPADWIVIELQAEPWASEPYQNVSRAERDKTMDPEKFKDTLEFARLAGFKEFYLWGVEWWYWEKEVNKRGDFWEIAKEIYADKDIANKK